MFPRAKLCGRGSPRDHFAIVRCMQCWLLDYITSYVCTLCMLGCTCERGTQYRKRCQPTRAAQTTEPVTWQYVRQKRPYNNAVYYVHTTGYVLFCCPHTITSVTYIQRHNQLCACTSASEVHVIAKDVNQHALHKRQNRSCGNLYDRTGHVIMLCTTQPVLYHSVVHINANINV